MCAIKGKLYVAGGVDSCKVHSSAESLDIATKKWTKIPDMKHARENPGKYYL